MRRVTYRGKARHQWVTPWSPLDSQKAKMADFLGFNHSVSLKTELGDLFAKF
jgi:hypothetical protein